MLLFGVRGERRVPARCDFSEGVRRTGSGAFGGSRSSKSSSS